MAVVKIKYSRRRSALKAHLRYITHRRGQDKQVTTRALFSENGAVTKQAAYALIDSAAPGTVFYKVVLSPDPRREDARRDLNLWQLTHKTAGALAEALNKPIRFIAVEHNDHTPNRHVHALFLLSGRLSRKEFSLLARLARQAATQDALLQRRTRDRVNFPRLHRKRLLRQTSYVSPRVRRVRLSRWQAACSSCGYGGLTGIPAFYTYCPACRVKLRKERQAGLSLELTR